jgi:nucleoside 2-deoxyribosyltransferase
VNLENNKIYLAGPEVFFRDPMKIAKEKKQLCVEHGFASLFPLDVKIKAEGIPIDEVALRIRRSNESLIRSCGMVIANITPFRGVSIDVGTAYEIGFARALGKPCFMYSNSYDDYEDRVIDQDGGIWYQRADGTNEDTEGLQIENFGLIDNLMVAGIDIDTDYWIVTNTEDKWNDLTGFKRCLAEAKRRSYWLRP